MAFIDLLPTLYILTSLKGLYKKVCGLFWQMLQQSLIGIGVIYSPIANAITCQVLISVQALTSNHIQTATEWCEKCQHSSLLLTSVPSFLWLAISIPSRTIHSPIQGLSHIISELVKPL